MLGQMRLWLWAVQAVLYDAKEIHQAALKAKDWPKSFKTLNEEQRNSLRSRLLLKRQTCEEALARRDAVVAPEPAVEAAGPEVHSEAERDDEGACREPRQPVFLAHVSSCMSRTKVDLLFSFKCSEGLRSNSSKCNSNSSKSKLRIFECLQRIENPGCLGPRPWELLRQQQQQQQLEQLEQQQL